MPSLAFAKLVATPTATAWSQVYNAGNLFASLSLSMTTAGEETDDAENLSLHSIGKDIFSSIEAEFFTLEEKDLEHIKEAVQHTAKTIPDGVDANLCLVYFKENILYVFILGIGTVIMKRGEQTGILLKKTSVEDKEIVSSSGLLHNGDTIILQTPQFAEDMPLETIKSALELNLPNDIAEALSPAMHEKDDGGQAAIIINYQGNAQHITEEKPERNTLPDTLTGENITTEEEILEQVKAEEQMDEEIDIPHENVPTHLPSTTQSMKFNLLQFLKDKLASFFSLFKKTPISGLNHRNKFFLSIAVLILIVLVVSVSLSKKREEDKKTAALFASVYDPALNNYEDGLEVKSINEEFARGDFIKAQKTLKDASGKFKKGSQEEKKINDLLAKVDKELGGETATEDVIKPKEISASENDFLSVVRDNSSGTGFSKNGDTAYFVTDKAVVSVDGNGSKKDVIKNDGDWKKATGVSFYQGNIYVLDASEGVLKFTAGSGGFGKSSYLKSKLANISSSTAIAIDGSVWILFKDGKISKFTRGISDDFKSPSLDKPMKNPTKIFTNLDTDNLYVLDSGNSRIIKLSKEGSFQGQYNAGILRSAKDFEVNEADGKILVLSGDKIWELPL